MRRPERDTVPEVDSGDVGPLVFLREDRRDRPGALDERHRGASRFNTARRAFAMLDLISRREGATAKSLARELGVSLSTCYCLINILAEEGFVQKVAHRKGYRLGPAVGTLYRRSRAVEIDAAVEPVVGELAVRSGRHAYLGLLDDGEATLARVEMPKKKPPVGLVAGGREASHALAIGKILISASGPAGLGDYVEDCGLKAFTPRTIVEPDRLRAHLAEIEARGFATDPEEFAEDLCCIAAPISSENGKIEGAVGISTTARHFYRETDALISLVSGAARDASELLR